MVIKGLNFSGGTDFSNVIFLIWKTFYSKPEIHYKLEMESFK